MSLSAPGLGDVVHYRGNQGLHAMRAAMVTATTATLDPRGVEAGHVPPLTDEQHVHLWVFTPSSAGGFAEYDVPRGEPGPGGEIPPGTWRPAG